MKTYCEWICQEDKCPFLKEELQKEVKENRQCAKDVQALEIEELITLRAILVYNLLIPGLLEKELKQSYNMNMLVSILLRKAEKGITINRFSETHHGGEGANWLK